MDNVFLRQEDSMGTGGRVERRKEGRKKRIR